MRMLPMALVFALTVSGAARAEPLFAARTGLGCGSCHLNRTGGGGRTAYGAGYGAQCDEPSDFEFATHSRPAWPSWAVLVCVGPSIGPRFSFEGELTRKLHPRIHGPRLP